MKKLVSLLLVLTMLFTLVACGANNNAAESETAPAPEITAPAATEATQPAEETTPTEPEKEIIKDTNGNEFEIPMEINKAIVINSSIYEMICVLGKDDIVIGVGESQPVA